MGGRNNLKKKKQSKAEGKVAGVVGSEDRKGRSVVRLKEEAVIE